MDKPSKTREQRRRGCKAATTFTACIVLALALPEWINLMLGWWGR